jgi:histidinol-phosphate aminotransferase
MKPLVGHHIESLKAYVPGKPIEELERELGIENPIKLASNENPLGPSPKAIEAIVGAASGAHIYPDGAAFYLKEALARRHGISEDELVIGNGSNEVLTMLVRTFMEPSVHNAVVSAHSFVAYRIILQSHGVETVTVPMTDGLEYDLGLMSEAISDRTKMVFIANPNNPTGTYKAAEELRAFLERTPDDTIVVIDEAYHEYVQAEDYASALTMRDIHPRLVVTRTFSKAFGLAGLRCGYGVTTPEMADYVNRVREPFNSNLIAQKACVEALEDVEFLERAVTVNEEGREILEAGFAQMSDLGVDWIASQTNFLLAKMPVAGVQVFEAMQRRGVIIRPMAGYGLADWVRISIGTPDQNQRCVEALRQTLEELT